MKSTFVAASVAILLNLGVNAAVLTFEGFAPSGTVVNINPIDTYTEQGFTLTPNNGASGVFDVAAVAHFPGDLTSWFGFAGGNIITLTGPAPFLAGSLLIGPSTIGSGTVDVDIVANLVGGGTSAFNYTGLSTATTVTLNVANVESLVITSSTDAGLDNITLNAVPEPGSFVLVAAGALLAGIRRIRATR